MHQYIFEQRIYYSEDQKCLLRLYGKKSFFTILKYFAPVVLKFTVGVAANINLIKR